jgi:hypothetical protein
MRAIYPSAAVVLWAASLLAAPTDYTFKSVVSTRDGAFTAVSNAAINNNGKVAFNGVLTDGTTSGIYTGPNPATDTFADTQANFGAFQGFGRPAINDSGRIVFTAVTSGIETGIYDGPSPGNLLIPSTSYSGMKDPVMNNNGKFAFWGVHDDNVQGIFIGPDPANHAVADTSTYSFFNDLVGPRITSDGTVYFIASPPDFRTGIFTGKDTSKPVVDTSGLIGGVRSFDINDKGDVIVAVQLDDETPALLRGKNPLTDQLSLQTFGFAGEHLAINNDGGIVFDGQDRSGNSGIFTGDDSSADRVVKVGDQLFGETLEDLFWDNLGFNDQGEIAFAYRLADDTVGIAIATPRTDGDGGGGGTAIPLPPALRATCLLACAFTAHSTLRKLRASMPA